MAAKRSACCNAEVVRFLIDPTTGLDAPHCAACGFACETVEAPELDLRSVCCDAPVTMNRFDLYVCSSCQLVNAKVRNTKSVTVPRSLLMEAATIIDGRVPDTAPGKIEILRQLREIANG